MPSKRRRVRAFTILLYCVAAVELALAVVYLGAGPALAALLLLGAAVVTAAIAHAFWRGFEQRGEDHWRYSWRALGRKLRG